MLQSPFR